MTAGMRMGWLRCRPEGGNAARADTGSRGRSPAQGARVVWLERGHNSWDADGAAPSTGASGGTSPWRLRPGLDGRGADGVAEA
jgi:hypothetical protein